MAKFLFVLTRGPEDPVRATRSFLFAKLAAEQGHEVNFFLADDAVMFTNLLLVDRVKTPTGDELKGYLQTFLEKGGTVHVCKPCADTRMISEEDLPNGFQLAMGSFVIEQALDSQVFTF